jgi:hypothetical protein
LALPRSAFGGVQDFAGPFGEMHTLISRGPRGILGETYGVRITPAARAAAIAHYPALDVPLAPGKVFTPATHAS